MLTRRLSWRVRQYLHPPGGGTGVGVFIFNYQSNGKQTRNQIKIFLLLKLSGMKLLKLLLEGLYPEYFAPMTRRGPGLQIVECRMLCAYWTVSTGLQIVGLKNVERCVPTGLQIVELRNVEYCVPTGLQIVGLRNVECCVPTGLYLLDCRLQD